MAVEACRKSRRGAFTIPSRHERDHPYRPEIRFSDVDAYGVVHNAKYIVYMEQARIHWWRQAMGEGTWDWSKVGVLVAHHTIDYVRPVRLGDVLEVSSHIGALGNKSMDVHYEMTCNGHPVARAKTVLVCFDHQTQGHDPCARALAPSPRRVHRVTTQTLCAHDSSCSMDRTSTVLKEPSP